MTIGLIALPYNYLGTRYPDSRVHEPPIGILVDARLEQGLVIIVDIVVLHHEGIVSIVLQWLVGAHRECGGWSPTDRLSRAVCALCRHRGTD